MGFFKEKPNQAYPGVPDSLNHDSFEMRTAKSQDSSDAAATRQYDSAGSITPYLGLRARLSQVWFNRWTVLLMLVLVRVVILVGGLHDDIGDAETQALAACTKVEDVGSAMASMPHYLSVGVNDLAADGITKTVHGMVELLMMILTGVEQLILFVINMYIGTYVCLSSALIHGTLDIGIGAADDVTEVMNSAIDDITTGLSDDVSAIQDTINSAFSAISDAASVFGKDLTPPTINITGRIDDLKNIQVDDTDFVKTLSTLNTSIPTYDQAENFTRNAISIPFNLVKTTLNKTYGAYDFDTSVFPVAKKQALTFCSDNSVITDFFNALFEIADHAKVAFIVTLAILAVLACVPMTWLEIRRYRSQQRRAKLLAKHGYDPMDVVYIASRPYTAEAGIKISSRFLGKRQLLARWVVAYSTSFPALFVLSLALAGFFSCICQAILLSVIQKEAPALTSQVSSFADDVVSTLEDVSTGWATDANGVILDFQNEINNDVLGYVANATTAVNNTLNVFTDEINEGISDAFNGTVLESTVKEIVRCLIGLKIDAVEQGLTWVHDNAHVTMPLFPNNTFSVGAQDSISNDSSLTSFLASPSSVTTDEVTAAVDKVVTFLHNSLIQEALISTGLLLVYVIVILIGVVWAMSCMIRPERTRAEGGQRFYPQHTANSSNGMDQNGTYIAKNLTGRPEHPSYFLRVDNESESATVDDLRGIKGREASMESETSFSRTVVSGKGKEQKGHWRGSSYGGMEDTGN